MTLDPVTVGALDLERIKDLLGERRIAQMRAVTARGRERWAGRATWNVDSTARGGVAKMLASLLACARVAGVDARWSALAVEQGCCRITKGGSER